MLRSYRDHGPDYYRILVRRVRRGKIMPSAMGTVVPGAADNVDSRELLERICEMLTTDEQPLSDRVRAKESAS